MTTDGATLRSYLDTKRAGGLNQRQFFINRINLITVALANQGARKLLLLGDFNLDERNKFHLDYSHKMYYDVLIQAFEPLGLPQLVE